jgi:hypothetical protein
MLDEIKGFHIEPTNICTLKCPGCARTRFIDQWPQHWHNHCLDRTTLKSFLDIDLSGVEVSMCGNYGDPAAGQHTLEIFQYFRSINPSITLGMNTNGGLRSTTWWQKLATIMNQPKDYVIWSIDGLEDTNHIYRINVDWNKVIDNAQAFIQAGGNAHWDMLIYEHNEHQVSAAEFLAQQLGFKWFRGKVSRRFENFPITFLKPPKNFKNDSALRGEIVCAVLKEHSVYLSYQGDLYPCCWLGSSTNKIDQFENIQKTWLTDQPMQTCFQTCASIKQNNNSFDNQWQFEKEFV